jgi:single-strand DNA-binding protein
MTGQEIIAAVLRASCHRLIGYLAADPEIRYLESGSVVAKARMPINRPGAKRGDGQEPDWFTIEVWGDQAQAFADQCRKGSRVDVLGRVSTNSWNTREGEARTDLIVKPEVWRLLEQPAAQAAPAQAPAVAPAAGAASAAAPAPTTPAWDEEPPF